MTENKTEKSLRWIGNQILDFTPTTNEEKMLLAIKRYCTAGAEEIKRLESKNAELKARLENAVKFPCQYGDEIYSILDFGKESIVLKGRCKRVMYEKSASVSITRVWGVFEDDWQLHPYTFTNESLKFIFKTRKEAEARLAELKG